MSKERANQRAKSSTQSKTRNVYIVEPSPKSDRRFRLGKWRVRAQKTGATWGFMFYKQEAIDKGRELAILSAERGSKSQLVIKGLDGKIQKEYTYPRSSDPRRHKG